MINVVGLGYIGLPTALMFAAHGVEVVGTDYNKELVDTLNEGKTTFEEDGLDELFQEAVSKGIRFSHEYQSTDMYIVAVPTPYDKASKKGGCKLRGKGSAERYECLPEGRNGGYRIYRISGNHQ